MLFEIANPHDPYTMEADSLEVAAVAICVLGEGRYGLTQTDAPAGTKPAEVPIFLFDGHDEWFIQNFARDFRASVAQVDLAKVADALASVKLGREQRSSMVDMGGRAQDLAQAIRFQLPQATPAHAG